jgi:quinol monooxygenase YgiN
MPLHVFIRFEPQPGKQQQLRQELLLVLEPTRAEPGCIRIHLYETSRDPLAFFIHSEWTDDAAFDAHAKLAHMTRFLGLVGDLVTHPVQAFRTRRIS